MASVELESEGKLATNGIVKAETAAAEDLVLEAEVVKETGESLGGAGDLTSVEFGSEDKSTNPGVAKTETAATGSPVMWAG